MAVKNSTCEGNYGHSEIYGLDATVLFYNSIVAATTAAENCSTKGDGLSLLFNKDPTSTQPSPPLFNLQNDRHHSDSSGSEATTATCPDAPAVTFDFSEGIKASPGVGTKDNLIPVSFSYLYPTPGAAGVDLKVCHDTDVDGTDLLASPRGVTTCSFGAVEVTGAVKFK